MTTTQIDHEMRNWDNPTPAMVADRIAERDAFEAYRKREVAKKIQVKTRFGSSRFHDLVEALAFAASLSESYTITHHA